MKQLPERALATRPFRFDKRIGLVQVAAHHQCRNRQQRPDHERYPPAPCSQLSGSQQYLLQNEQNPKRAQLPSDQRHVLKAGIKAAMLLVAHLAQISSAGPVVTAETQSLNDAGKTKQSRRRRSDGGVGRRDGNHQRSETHEQDRQHERIAPPVMVGQVSEQPAADRTHDGADRKQNGRIQLLDDGIVARKERSCKVERKCRVDIEVIPFDEIAYRADEDRLQTALDIGKPQTVIFDADGSPSHAQYNTAFRLIITARVIMRGKMDLFRREMLAEIKAASK